MSAGPGQRRGTRPVDSAGAATGAPRLVLRLEGLAIAAAALLAYRHMDAGWGMFAALLLAPDLSLLAYLAGPRAGAVFYNAAHSYLLPALLAGTGLALGRERPVAVALIWIAHVGIDRALGYGLKYPGGFGLTHLGRIGKAQADGDQKPSPD
ncbi:DUF4260 domain-containing protein [Ancylobacter oerskovii]|uniref:DUF4260 domain-containing protein n=1 Tax=Ancylobacter oerskovii TaxID=459519 RepID=A0ABW4YSY1_9HYPH|nr:DUF4260 domain-containing protein [Ancylobacter oerskovii]MBS7545186.1 DUF4260 domain-containing protein [Ancylobacter oerskovii]